MELVGRRTIITIIIHVIDTIGVVVSIVRMIRVVRMDRVGSNIPVVPRGWIVLVLGAVLSERKMPVFHPGRFIHSAVNVPT